MVGIISVLILQVTTSKITGIHRKITVLFLLVAIDKQGRVASGLKQWVLYKGAWFESLQKSSALFSMEENVTPSNCTGMQR